MRFSIATPVYNGMPWLPCCLASVADQRGGDLDIEHIVHDGGSTDGSLEVLKRAGDVQWKSEPDSGMYDAVNKCWKGATGEICSYLNADEQYLPGVMSLVASVFSENPGVDMVFGDALVIDGGGNPLSYRRIVSPTAMHTRIVHLGTMSCSMFFHRRLLDEGYFFDIKWKAIGDAEWLYRLLMRGVKIRMVRVPLAAFAMTGMNLGASANSLAEAARWKSESPGWQRGMGRLLRLQHWIRKLLANAYGLREVSAELFSLKSPETRVVRKSTRVSSAWPQV